MSVLCSYKVRLEVEAVFNVLVLNVQPSELSFHFEINEHACRDVSAVTHRVPDGIPLTSASGCPQTPAAGLGRFIDTVTDG